MKTRSYDRVKRTIDIVVAAALLALTLPLMLVIAVLIRITMGRPVLFRHTRPGQHGRTFELLKFRSMLPAEDHREAMPSHARITPLGHLIRSTSVDELPSLINVLRGEMSLVGPRPLLVRYLPRYSAHQARRHEVRPGITGLAQVSGRNTLTWEEKFDLDVEYVRNRSLSLDLRILLRTLTTAASRRGVNASSDATMTEFMGTPR